MKPAYKTNTRTINLTSARLLLKVLAVVMAPLEFLVPLESLARCPSTD